ncbi:Na-Ca exchanger/integrin-beta4 domain protein, partial [Candidatus Magnetomorum sp. HK-1]
GSNVCTITTLAQQSVNIPVEITPTASSYGMVTITVCVTDSTGLSSTYDLPIIINSLPTISSIDDQSLLINSSLNSLSFTITDNDTSVGLLSISKQSSYTNLISVDSILIEGSGGPRSISITPTTDQSGTAMITINVVDGNIRVFETFEVEVRSFELSTISDQVTDEDTALENISITLAGQPVNITCTAVSSNVTLVSNNNIVITGSGSNRNVSITPNADEYGIVTITISSTNGSITSTASFNLTVTEINDPPVITNITNQVIDENTSTQPISFTITDVESNPENLTLSALTSNSTLVPVDNIVFSGTSSSRTVDITPASGQNGSVTITIQVTDGNLTSDTSFCLTVNDVIVISNLLDQTINEDTSTGAISFTISSLNMISTTASFSYSFGTNGTGTGQFNEPYGVAIDSSERIIVSEYSGHRVQVFSSSGSYEYSIGTGSSGTQIGEFFNPTGMATDNNDNIYVVGHSEHRAQVFTSSGAYSYSIGYGTIGSNLGQFNYPLGISIDSNGLIYIVDIGNNRVQVFSSSGAYDYSIGTGSSGSGPGEFNYPQDINFNSLGDIYVTEYNNKRVQVFDSSGNYKSNFGSSGTGSGQFDNPIGICIDSFDNIYVSDYALNRIEVFNSSGAYEYRIGTGSSGSGQGEFNGPAQLAVDDSGNLYVADKMNHRVQVFTISSAESITFTFDSSNTSLIPIENISYTCNSGNCTLNVNPASNQSGTSTITVMATVLSGVTATSSFNLTVTEINDSPQISNISNQYIGGANSVSITFTATDPESADCSLGLTITSSNQILIPDSNLSYSCNANNYTLIATKAANEFGYAMITVVVDDGIATSESQFTITTIPVIAFNPITYTSTENSGLISITTTLSHAIDETISADFTVIGGTASSGSDFTPNNGTLILVAGATSKVFTLSVIDDTHYESAEKLILGLSNFMNVTQTTGPGISYTLTINDNDSPPTISWTPAGSSVSENSGSVQITATLSIVSGLAASIDYTVGGTATNGMDYTLADGTLTIAAGLTSSNITIDIGNDIIDENSETVIIRMVTYTNTANGVSTEYTLTIIDDDNPPTISFSPSTSTFTEDSGVVSITATLSLPSEKVISADCMAISGTAISGLDYTLNIGTLTFAAGATAQVFNLTLTDDILDENTETVIISLSNFVNVSQTTGSGLSYTLSINDNDNAPTVAWSAPTYNVSEDSASMLITATLSSVSAKNITVDYTVSDISAINGTDFTLANGVLSFPAGTTTETQVINIVDDPTFEPTESFSVHMIAYTNVSAGGTTIATIEISDNDIGPTISWTPAGSSASENSGSVQITATLSMVSGLASSIDYTVGGTATNGMDYTLADGTLTIAAGLTSSNITIDLGNDIIDENSETVILRMVTYTNTANGVSTEYTLTIIDDDNPPTISFDPISKNSPESTAIVSIHTTLSSASEKMLSADFSTIGGTASSGIDYTLINGTLTFMPGETTKAITCSVADDSIEEVSETILVGLSNFVNVTKTGGADSSFTLTIMDNDSPVYISPVAEQTTNINTAINIIMRITQTEAQPLTLIIQTSDSGLVLANNISITGTGAENTGNAYILNVSASIENYTATFLPETDASGSCQITLTVINPTGVTDQSTFILNITNGAPEISVLNPQVTLENLSISLVLSITDTINGVLSLTGVSSNELLVVSEGLQLTHASMGTSSNGYSLAVLRNEPETITLTISPATYAYGNSEISITIINASGLSATESFMLTVVDAASRSITLDGINDQVIYDSNFLEDPTNAISIEAWIYLYTNTTDMAILSYGNDTHDSISVEHKSYNVEMRLKNASQSEFVNFKNLSADPIPSEKWCHVCVMWDNSLNKAVFFLNGQLQHENTFSSDSIGYSDSRQLYMGSFFGQSKWFQGRLDEIRLWKTSLPATTIKEWMYKSITEDHPYYSDLVAYYPISSVDGNRIFDTCNHNHAYLYENSTIGSGPTKSQFISVNNWLNTNTNDWNDPMNWEAEFVPNQTNPGYVVINAGMRQPVLNSPSIINNIVLTKGASYKASQTNYLEIRGKFFNIMNTVNLDIGNSLTIFSSLDFKTDKIVPVIANAALTITTGEAINIQWDQAADDKSLSTNLEYAVVMSKDSQSCLETLEQIATNITPCEIETVIPFQIVSASGSGDTIRSVSGNRAEVEISGLSSDTYYFNVLVRDEMNNLSVYNAESIVFNTSPTSSTTFWVSPYSNYVNLLWYKATDNATPQEDIKYSIFYTTYDSSCLENMDQISPQTGSPCNVVIPNSQEVSSGTWDSGVRGTNIQTTSGGSMLTVDVEGLTSNTTYYFTVVAEDDDGNKFQYDIVTTMTAQ